MNYKELLFDTLEKLGTSKTNLGYDYIVYGLLLMEEDPHCISCESLRHNMEMCRKEYTKQYSHYMGLFQRPYAQKSLRQKQF